MPQHRRGRTPDRGTSRSIAAPILFLIAFFSVLIARELGVALRRHPHTAAAVAFVSVVVLLVGAAMVVVLAAQRIPELIWLVRLTGPLPFVHGYTGFLGATPFGMLWSAPWLASTTGRQPDDVWSTIWAGAAIAVVLFAIWTALMAWQLRPTRRLRVTRRWLSTGWFGRLPSTPTGAVAARSFSYWLRDPRYRTVFAVLPILPIAILGAFAVAGVPSSTACSFRSRSWCWCLPGRPCTTTSRTTPPRCGRILPPAPAARTIGWVA